VQPNPTQRGDGRRARPGSPMLRLRDPTTIGVSPLTRRVAEVKGVEGKDIEMGREGCNPHKGGRTESCPLVSFIFPCSLVPTIFYDKT
jgi:hypothetical protein